jgi:GNAT superfamily N-acetyltransferase
MRPHLDGYAVEIFETGNPTSSETAMKIETLFSKVYHSYHYMSEAISSDRTRILLKNNELLVGYCTVLPYGRFGYLSNLVVDPESQGRGLGSCLENERANVCHRLDLIPYVSCVTVGVQSQRSKVSMGLQRMNIKFGYRMGVFSENDVSSAATYSGSINGISQFTGNDATVLLSDQQRRLRHYCNSYDALAATLVSSTRLDDYYIEIFCPFEVCAFALDNPNLHYLGVDLDLSRQEYGFLLQIKNTRYRKSISQGLDLVEAEEPIPLTRFRTSLENWFPGQKFS